MSEIIVSELPARTLIGMSAEFYGAMSPKFNGQEMLGPLWGQIHAKRAELGLPATSTLIGATEPADSPEAANGLLKQFVGIVVDEVPADVKRLHLEIYDTRFDLESPDSIMTLAAPVKQN